MHIVFAAPECAPFVKTGGLGEVLGALPGAIAHLGHRVTVFVPYYRILQQRLEAEPDAPEPAPVLLSVTIPFAEANRFVRVLDGGARGGVQTYFVDCPEFFDRDGVYGPPGANYPDNALRYALYCRAVLEASKLLGVPDVFHCHDWQSALVPVLLATTYADDPLLRDAATVFTVHNGGYQGQFPPEVLPELLLPQSLYSARCLEAHGEVNLMQGGLYCSDALTTVSPHYAEELQTEAYGAGLDSVYRERRAVLTGILNGIDTTLWDPATDPHLAAHYTAADLQGKAECRRDLLHAYAADDVSERTAVIGIVSRLAAQKGFDLLAEALPALCDRDVLLLVLGGGEPELEAVFRGLAERHPQHLRVHCEFAETLAHKVIAGADMTLMPSRYEPAGLTQLYSQRYGTVPVVRRTGGLRDTVLAGPDGDGFTFEDSTSEALLAAVDAALAEFGDKPLWQARMQRGMAKDLSWDKPADAYLTVYERALAAHRAR